MTIIRHATVLPGMNLTDCVLCHRSMTRSKHRWLFARDLRLRGRVHIRCAQQTGLSALSVSRDMTAAAAQFYLWVWAGNLPRRGHPFPDSTHAATLVGLTPEQCENVYHGWRQPPMNMSSERIAAVREALAQFEADFHAAGLPPIPPEAASITQQPKQRAERSPA